MGAGKTLDLLKTKYNYNERKKLVMVFTSSKDNRYGENIIKSRTGLESPAYAVDETFNIFEYVKEYKIKPDCILVDEVQFFTKKQIFELTDIVDLLDIPVITYGLRSDFQLEPFEGSKYMLILADHIEELRTLCHKCNKKATLNIRCEDEKIVTDGEQIKIGGNESYISLCRRCYKKILSNYESK
jgi:thymidine kinase